MIVEKIHLTNFRNLKDISFEFKENINVFVGKNGIGKTNVLEAIYISLVASSFRQAKQEDFISFGENFTKVDTFVREKGFENKISFLYTDDKKKVFKIDDIKIKSVNELYDFSNVIGFFPDELKIITESPNFRRNFFDSFIMKMTKGYKQKLNLYRNVIFRRNLLLKGMNLSSFYKQEMNALTKKLALLCYEISMERKKLIDLINKEVNFIHQQLSGETLYIEYESILSNHKRSENECLKEILENFSRSYKIDSENKITSFGIHKENFKFILNGNDAKSFSSQGQKRNIIITIKMCQKNIFEEYKGVKPIILLDDLFSELDEDRRYEILEYLTDNQVFITTTDKSFVNNFKNINVIEMEKVRKEKYE
ncbi:DNA replication and repair protein RecF [Parvimonas micra]|uniref:DNA replication/repair protein RecF n=1 Tax=Parvimonas micra TaxID=33033 RepID=UPI002B46C6C6|nr:DNA replication and repair protein RecF [Parvimonas micra]MEB3060340.1 DNA replication and repair protein RecF [Parvimonas micra]MEB3066196.1 DNA replication and repair protein RecF [Parvimonas micra]